MNTAEPWPSPEMAGLRGRRMQAKLVGDRGSWPRFDDLFNFIYRPDFLVTARERMRGNKGDAPPGWTG